MKQRILTGWTFTRALYTLIGILIIIQAVMINQWMGLMVGGYFSAMGIFAFGCAGGKCLVATHKHNGETPGKDISFEEIKQQ
jgi:hypothetical protein